MDKPVISVIIPVYMEKDCFNRCITTVVNQIYRNLDIILVDDGLTDRCFQMCEDWADRDRRIRVLHVNNRNLSYARYCGLCAAVGKYVTFVDPDDWISLVMFEKMEKVMTYNDADIVICQYVFFHVDDWQERSIEEDNQTEIFSAQKAIKLLFDNKRVTSQLWGKLYKKERIPLKLFPVGSYFEEIYAMQEVFFNCSKIVCLNDAYYFRKENKEAILYKCDSVAKYNYLENSRRHCQKMEDLFPDLKDSIKLLWVNGIVRDWWYLKNNQENFEQEALRAVLLKEISKIKFRMIMQIICPGHSCERIYLFILKYFPQLENISYKFLFSKTFLDARIRFVGRIRTIVRDIEILRRLYHEKSENSKIFWILCVPEYGNLGDRALLFAEEEFILHYFPDYHICKIPFGQLDKIFFSQLSDLIGPNDFCAIQAGGNFGTLYPSTHMYQEYIISVFRKHKMIVFPQTFYYSEDYQGKQMLRRTQRIYGKCENLCLFVRESISYEFLKKNFPKIRSVLMPDMALFLSAYVTPKVRSGALIGIRADAERTIMYNVYAKVLTLLEERFDRVEDFDTHVYRNLNNNEARDEIIKLWDRMAGAQIVVTDRLHGMIFAAITQTPCILMLSKSHKIEGVYQWVKPLKYIQLVREEWEISDALTKVMSEEHLVYSLESVKSKFDEMAEIIREIMRE